MDDRAPVSRRPLRLGRPLGALVLAVSAVPVIAAASPVAAASKSAPTTTSTTTPVPAVNSWALSPSGDDPSQPGSRPNLSYELAPGATIKDSVTLWNYSNVQLTFRVYATDAFNNPAGAFELLAGDKAPTDAGTWVTLPQSYVTVAARTSLVLPITVTIPATARPGDHAGAVLASSQTPGNDAQGHHVMLDRRTGSRLYIRVAGPLHPALTVETVNSAYAGALNPLHGTLDVAYTVRNTGNTRLAGGQRVWVKNVFGRRVKQVHPRDLPELLPGNAITLHAHFKGLAAGLRLSITVSLKPAPVAASDNAGLPDTSRSGAAWAIPWSLVGLAVILGTLWRVVRARL